MLMRWDAQKYRPDKEREENRIFYAPFWFWLILLYGLWFASIKFATIFVFKRKMQNQRLEKYQSSCFCF